MNTNNSQKNNPEASLQQLMKIDEDQKDDLVDCSAIAKLEERIQKLEDEKNEERFLWILSTIILIDFILMPQINNSGASLIIGIIEIILIILLARKFGIDEVEKIFDKLLNIAISTKRKG
jgi:hypothetical protein